MTSVEPDGAAVGCAEVSLCAADTEDGGGKLLSLQPNASVAERLWDSPLADMVGLGVEVRRQRAGYREGASKRA